MKTFFESCGIADLVSCKQHVRLWINMPSGDHMLWRSKQESMWSFRQDQKGCSFTQQVSNKKIHIQPLAEVEKELLNGQSAQGPLTVGCYFILIELTPKYHGIILLMSSHLLGCRIIWSDKREEISRQVSPINSTSYSISFLSFPLFVTVHKICTGQLPPDQLINNIRNHPEHG
jgi:hypothetical protein